MADENTTDNSTGQDEPVNAGKTFTEADVERIIKERLDRQKQALASANAKAAKDAEDAALVARQEFQTLAEQRQARIAELEPLAAELEAYRTLVQQQVDAGVKNAPEHIRELLSTMAPTDALAWLTKHKDKVNPTTAPDVNARSRTEKVSDAERQAAAKAALRANGGYSGF